MSHFLQSETIRPARPWLEMALAKAAGLVAGAATSLPGHPAAPARPGSRLPGAAAGARPAAPGEAILPTTTHPNNPRHNT